MIATHVRTTPLKALILAAVLLAGSGCATQQTASVAAPSAAAFETLISDRLYFGRNIPGTTAEVSESDWQTFLADVVTPRFPDGLTVWGSEGQWRGNDGVIAREKGFILEFLHADDAKSEQSVQEIMTEYKTRFHQEAVLRVRQTVRAQFW